MDLEDGKTPRETAIVMTAVMLPDQANPAGNVHGGEIMKIMDNAAFVVAQRHARANAVTARVDELTFHHPIFVGNLVTCQGFLSFVGRTSMEVTVSVAVEDLFKEGPPKCALTAYFTMVALNVGGHPVRVPPLLLASEEEHQRFEEGRVRYERNRSKPKVCDMPNFCNKE